MPSDIGSDDGSLELWQLVSIGQLLEQLAQLTVQQFLEDMKGAAYSARVERLQELLAAMYLEDSYSCSRDTIAEVANDLDALANKLKKKVSQPNSALDPARLIEQVVSEMRTQVRILLATVSAEAKRKRVFLARPFNKLEPGRLMRESYYSFGLPDLIYPAPPNEVAEHLREAARCMVVGFSHGAAVLTYLATEAFVRYYCSCLSVNVAWNDTWGALNDKLRYGGKCSGALLTKLDTHKVKRDEIMHGRQIVSSVGAENIQTSCSRLVQTLLTDLQARGKVQIVSADQLESVRVDRPEAD